MAEEAEHQEYVDSEVLDTLRGELSKSFTGNDLICVYHVDKNGVLGIIGVMDKEGEYALGLEDLEKFSKAVNVTVETLGKHRKYVFVFSDWEDRSIMEYILKYYIRLKECSLEEVNTIPVHCSFYPSFEDFIEKNSGHLHNLSEGKVLLGGDGNRAKLLLLAEGKFPNKRGTMNRDVISYEVTAVGSYLEFLANAYIPYKTLVRSSLILLKYVMMNTGHYFLAGNYDYPVFCMKNFFEHRNKFPESMKEALDMLAKIRSMEDFPQSEEVTCLYKKCIKAIKEVGVLWV